MLKIEIEKLTTGAIKRLIADYEKLPEDLILALKSDKRKSVNHLYAKIQKQKQKIKIELARLEKMRIFEKQYIGKVIGGVDEAGRGPLAGPVVAAIVILPENENILYVNDSKKLSKKMREKLFVEIKNKAVDYSYGIVDNNEIDRINIINATKKAVEIAYNKLKLKPDVLLIDAMKIENLNCEQESIIKGDMKSVSIAAASIIAKVTRDKMMEEYHFKYPEYGFNAHKGYGTAKHIEQIKNIGYTPIHRKTFIKNFVNV